MIHLLPGGVLRFALTLHGLNINVSINQVICALSERTPRVGMAALPDYTIGDPSCRAMFPLVTRRREVYLPAVGPGGFWAAGAVAILGSRCPSSSCRLEI